MSLINMMLFYGIIIKIYDHLTSDGELLLFNGMFLSCKVIKISVAVAYKRY
jgi:hypothetical protein